MMLSSAVMVGTDPPPGGSRCVGEFRFWSLGYNRKEVVPPPPPLLFLDSYELGGC